MSSLFWSTVSLCPRHSCFTFLPLGHAFVKLGSEHQILRTLNIACMVEATAWWQSLIRQFMLQSLVSKVHRAFESLWALFQSFR